MNQGKLIVIEGTDCSGKETQTKRLINRLNSENVSCATMSFPRYETPTGKIVGGPYLGKPEICESWFENGPCDVDQKIASLYYAADRLNSLPEIKQILESETHLILDRYVSSNMAHQGGKIAATWGRREFYRWLDNLEYDFLELPRPDLTLFLCMPYQIGVELKKGRAGERDGHERDLEHLKNAEKAYLQLSHIYNWEKIECSPEGTFESLRTPDDIHGEVYSKVLEKIRGSITN